MIKLNDICIQYTALVPPRRYGYQFKHTHAMVNEIGARPLATRRKSPRDPRIRQNRPAKRDRRAREREREREPGAGSRSGSGNGSGSGSGRPTSFPLGSPHPPPRPPPLVPRPSPLSAPWLAGENQNGRTNDRPMRVVPDARAERIRRIGASVSAFSGAFEHGAEAQEAGGSNENWPSNSRKPVRFTHRGN